jgi:hypothetical protein
LKNTKNKVEIHGVFLCVLKSASEKTMFTTQTTTFPPSTHHNKTPHFATTPLKTAAKPQTEHSEPIDDFFLKQAPDSYAWTADKDV